MPWPPCRQASVREESRSRAIRSLLPGNDCPVPAATSCSHGFPAVRLDRICAPWPRRHSYRGPKASYIYLLRSSRWPAARPLTSGSPLRGPGGSRNPSRVLRLALLALPCALLCPPAVAALSSLVPSLRRAARRPRALLDPALGARGAARRRARGGAGSRSVARAAGCAAAEVRAPATTASLPRAKRPQPSHAARQSPAAAASRSTHGAGAVGRADGAGQRNARVLGREHRCEDSRASAAFEHDRASKQQSRAADLLLVQQHQRRAAPRTARQSRRAC